MRPIEFIPSHSAVPEKNAGNPMPVEETIVRFLTLSAHYLNLPAERLKHLNQQKK